VIILHPTHQTLSRHLDGALPADRARRVEAHLERCAACARKVEILREAAELCRPPRKALDAVMNGLMDRLGQPDWQPDAPALAEALEVHGLVHVHRTDSHAPALELFPGCLLRAGDRIEPAPGATVTLGWTGGGRVRLDHPTLLGPGGLESPATPICSTGTESSSSRRARVVEIERPSRLRPFFLQPSFLSAAASVLIFAAIAVSLVQFLKDPTPIHPTPASPVAGKSLTPKPAAPQNIGTPGYRPVEMGTPSNARPTPPPRSGTFLPPTAIQPLPERPTTATATPAPGPTTVPVKQDAAPTTATTATTSTTTTQPLLTPTPEPGLPRSGTVGQ
jgi:hypothetical protein